MKKEFGITIEILDFWIDNLNAWMNKERKIGFVGKLYILAEWSGELHLLEKDLK